MSAEENKALVRRFVEEFWNEGNTTAADELMAIDAVIHMPTGEVVDLDGLKSFVGTFRETFSDWHSSVEELIAEGDKVAER
jgi:predicted ester cyclase